MARGSGFLSNHVVVIHEAHEKRLQRKWLTSALHGCYLQIHVTIALWYMYGQKPMLSQAILRVLTIKPVKLLYTPAHGDISLSINLIRHPFHLFRKVYEQVPRVLFPSIYITESSRVTLVGIY